MVSSYTDSSPGTCSWAIYAAICLLAASTATTARAQYDGADWTAASSRAADHCEVDFFDCCCDNCGYGPGPCERRWTLLQWSYGTSFEGGAPLDEPLVTDRPDFTEASTTVGRGVNQIELGYGYFYDEEGDTSIRTHSYPQVLWRRGILADWLELRVAWSYTEERVTTAGVPASASDSDDIYLGFKIALTPQECWLPEMAIIPQMTIPVGGPFSVNEVQPGLNWLYSWEINDRLSIGGSTQGNRAADGVTGDFYIEFAQSITTGISLTERVGAYVEWFAFFPSSADTEVSRHFIDGGFTYLWSDDLQLDVFAGVGLNEAAADYFLGTGASFRF